MRWIFLLLTLFVFAGCKNSKQELHVYTWAELIDQKTIRSFEEEFNCRVIVDSYDSNETLYAKLKSGADGYDLIMPTWYYVQIMHKQEMLSPIDNDKIANSEYLDREVLEPLSGPAVEYCFPFSISYQGIGYRSDKVSRPTSMSVFNDPRLYKRMTLLNDLREVIGAALLYLGYSPNSTDANEIRAAADLCLKWRRNIAKFDSELYKSGLATGEFLVVQCISGDLLQVAQEDPVVKFSIPDIGSTVSYDMICVPKKSKNKELAHAFINHLYNPKISASIMERIFEIIPNKQAYPLLSENIRNNPAIFPDSETWQRLHILEDVGEALRIYSREWTRIKDG